MLRLRFAEALGAVRPGVIVSGAVAASLITVVIALGGGGGGAPPGTANIWIDTNGGACQDSASPVSYSDAQACSWDQANDTCEGGDTIGVRGGSYGSITLTGSNSRSSVCTATVQTGEQVVMTAFNAGTFTAPGAGTNWITIDAGSICRFETSSCGIRVGEFDADFTNRVSVRGWDIDGQNAVLQLFHFDDVTNFSASDSRIHNACAAGTTGAMSWGSGAGPVNLDNNDFYNAYVCDDNEPHTECMFSNGIGTLNFTRNRVFRCNAQGLFFSGSTDPGGTIANNYFGRTCSGPNNDCTTPHGAPNAMHFRTGGEPSPSPNNMDIVNNTFRGNLSISGSENAPTAGGLRVYNNVFLAGVPCGLPNTTYGNNAFLSGPCGGSGNVVNGSLLTNSFVDPSDFATNGGDWHLLSGSPLRNAADPTRAPATDRDGIVRDGTPDIGAYEFL